MRKLFPSVACLVLLAVGCDVPTSPAPGPPPAPTTPSPFPPSPFPGAPFSEIFTQIVVGELVTSRVSADDPLCVGEPLWPCKYFRLTAPRDGVLDVAMTVKPHSMGTPNLDLSFSDSEGSQWWAPLIVPVKAGATYQITVWEYAFPGVEFELRSSYRSD